MPNLLSRFAEDVYWLGRYMERVESLARIIDITKTYAGSDQDSTNWRRVLALYGDAVRFAEEGKTADASSVLAFYLHDVNNPTSVAYALARAHDNARGARHLISTEMWTQLNVVRRQQDKMTLRDLRLPNVSAVCQKLKTDCQTFEGIVEGTLTQSEIWVFYQIGKLLERADQTTRVLDIGYTSGWSRDDDAVNSVRWNTLVRSLAGYHAYRATYPDGRYPDDIADFLLYNGNFVRAVAFCVNRVKRDISAMVASAGEKIDPAIASSLEAMNRILDEGKGNKELHTGMSAYIDRLQECISDIGEAVAARYF